MAPVILPPPPDTEPELPIVRGDEDDSDTWDDIRQTSIATWRPTGE